MADDQTLTHKISSIKATLSKLSKSMKSAEGTFSDVQEFAGFKPKETEGNGENQRFGRLGNEREAAVLRQELGEMMDKGEEVSYRNEEAERQPFTLEDYIHPRQDSPMLSFRTGLEQGRGLLGDVGSMQYSNSLRSTLNKEATGLPDSEEKTQIQVLQDRINAKDTIIKEQNQQYSQLQTQLDSIRTAFKQAKQQSEHERDELELALDHEKRLRDQAETILRETKLELEETKIQLRVRSTVGTMEGSGKKEANTLHTKLEETNKLKVTLLSENAELHNLLQNKDLELLKIKEELRLNSNKTREGGARNEEINAEMRNFQKEITKLRIENEELRFKDVQIDYLTKEKLSLEEEIARLKEEKPVQKFPDSIDFEEFEHRILGLEQRLSKAMSENDNLYLELSSRPTHKQLKEKERAIEDLQLQVQELEQKETRAKAVKSVSPRARSRGRTNQSKHRADSRSAKDDFSIEDLMSALHVTAPAEILHKIKKLRKAKSSAEKLVERLASLVQECSPRGTFPQSPKHKEIWKWTRRLAEEYMNLKQSHEAQKVNSELISEVLEILGLVYPSEVPKGIRKLIEENTLMKELLEKVKTRLELSPRTSLEELEQHLAASHQ